ncbi:MAG: hypothetical protein M1813_008071 [Trichoglossum hirsutum]|nr:MAG: hypothetical protein M1813_008071 [Trichoglossum hirsutum]
MVGHLQQAQDEVEGFYSNSEPAEPISYRSESDPGSALRGTAFAATSSSCPRELSGPDVRGISTRLQPRLVVVTQAEGAQELSEPASPDDTSMQKASRSSMTNLARHNENPEPIDLGKNKVIKHSWGKHGSQI